MFFSLIRSYMVPSLGRIIGLYDSRLTYSSFPENSQSLSQVVTLLPARSLYTVSDLTAFGTIAARRFSGKQDSRQLWDVIVRMSVRSYDPHEYGDFDVSSLRSQVYF